MFPKWLWLGSCADEKKSDRSNRQNCWKEEKLHLLCFWKLLDESDLLASSLEKLNDEEWLDSDSVPSTVEHSTKDKYKERKIEDNFKRGSSLDFKQLSCSVALNECHELAKSAQSLKANLRKSTNEE